MIDLAKFCDPNRAELAAPFPISNDLTGAADGIVLLIVPARDGDGRVPSMAASRARRLFTESIWTAEPVALREWSRVTLPEMVTCKPCNGRGRFAKCTSCNGTGERTCDMGHDHDCPPCQGSGEVGPAPEGAAEADTITCDDCNGAGQVKNRTHVPVEIMPDCFIDQPVLDRLATLPGLMFRPVPGRLPESPLAFTFDGGQGLVMECRPRPNSPHVVRLDPVTP